MILSNYERMLLLVFGLLVYLMKIARNSRGSGNTFLLLSDYKVVTLVTSRLQSGHVIVVKKNVLRRKPRFQTEKKFGAQT